MIILIDDDKFIRLSWTLMAKKLGINIHSFEDCASFINQSWLLNKDFEVFIDSNLARGEKGEIESKKIYDLGFHKIYLCTGYTDMDISEFSWLKGLVSKEFPHFLASNTEA
jgi:hypothetical protein